jgi:exopolyphosphatase/guanosine-5'-triphosphate,3'-diphosphate pyrophosphatase
LIDLICLLQQDRLLFEVAAIVHEVGSFIGRRSHHKHSLYIIKHSEIFGLNDEETSIVALVARYHRHALPEADHPYMGDLTREGRIRVSKLASLLRVADALDRSHTQHLQVQKVRVHRDKLLLHVGNVVNVSVEELGLRSKADLFEQVFGLEVVLETG